MRGTKAQRHGGAKGAEMPALFPLGFFSVVSFCVFCVIGCSPSHPSTQPSTVSERADQALRDPFGYNPQSTKYPDVSGGDLGHFDKDAMRKDLDDVLNP